MKSTFFLSTLQNKIWTFRILLLLFGAQQAVVAVPVESVEFAGKTEINYSAGLHTSKINLDLFCLDIDNNENDGDSDDEQQEDNVEKVAKKQVSVRSNTQYFADKYSKYNRVKSNISHNYFDELCDNKNLSPAFLCVFVI